MKAIAKGDAGFAVIEHHAVRKPVPGGARKLAQPPEVRAGRRRRRLDLHARDGSLTVRFRAGGIDEMCWHLYTWGESVTVEKPVRLRRRLAGMCESLAAHHREYQSPRNRKEQTG